METKAFINFSYTNPIQDFEESLQFMDDGSINKQLTLLNMKNKLLANLKVVDDLINNTENIVTMHVEDFDNVSVIFSEGDTGKNLIANGTLRKNVLIYNGFNDHLFSDDLSSDEIKLTVATVLEPTSEFYFNTSQDLSESESEDELIDFDIETMINKYQYSDDSTEV